MAGDAKIPDVKLTRKSSTLAATLIFVSIPFLPTSSVWGSKNKAGEMAGAVLFRDKGCAHCHGANLVGTKKGPSLVNIEKNKLWPPDKLKNQILNGGQKMPPFADSLSDQEIAQIIDYLRARHRPVPPPATTITQE